jgi:endoglucanase
MPEITPFLKSLLSAAGISSYETPATQLIEEKWRPLVDETRLSRIGSLEALKKGSAAEPRPSIMVATHMDAIGMMVTSIADGFLHFTQVGGIDPRILPGTPVIVHASASGEELPGIVVMPPARALPASMQEGVVGLEYLLIDVGLLPKEVAAKVRTGDPVSFATEPKELAGEVISGHTLDNRASVAVLTVALEELQKKSHQWDIWAVATAQEEVSLGGAFTSAFGLRPQIAIAIDVTFAKGPGANDWGTFPLAKGPTLGFGPNLHPFLFKKFEELAKNLEIPYQTEVTPRHTGTDAYATQIAAEGIPTMVIGIPLRYMHTPVEIVALKDIQRAGRLLAEFIASLEPDFVEKIVWED